MRRLRLVGSSRWQRRSARAVRRGSATLDYVLVICIVLPLASFVFWAAPRILNRVFEMSSALISWPFQ